jgi:hypothetical protein
VVVCTLSSAYRTLLPCSGNIYQMTSEDPPNCTCARHSTPTAISAGIPAHCFFAFVVPQLFDTCLGSPNNTRHSYGSCLASAPPLIVDNCQSISIDPPANKLHLNCQIVQAVNFVRWHTLRYGDRLVLPGTPRLNLQRPGRHVADLILDGEPDDPRSVWKCCRGGRRRWNC